MNSNSVTYMGSFIAQLRKEQGLTQKELADQLGITDKAVSKWERGLSLPDITLLEPLANQLGVSLSDLLQGERTTDSHLSDPITKQSLAYAKEATKEQVERGSRWQILAIGLLVVLSLVNPILFGTLGGVLLLVLGYAMDQPGLKYFSIGFFFTTIMTVFLVIAPDNNYWVKRFTLVHLSTVLAILAVGLLAVHFYLRMKPVKAWHFSLGSLSLVMIILAVQSYFLTYTKVFESRQPAPTSNYLIILLVAISGIVGLVLFIQRLREQ